MQPPTTVYGLYGIMHGGAKTLTIMSGRGTGSLMAELHNLKNLTVIFDPGNLPILLEQRVGALTAAIDALNIEVLQKSRWDTQKAALGDSIYSDS